MLTPHIQHPLVFTLFLAEILAFVVFVHQGLLNLVVFRATRRPELRTYAAWCFWSAAFVCCFAAFVVEVGTTTRMLALHCMTITGALAMRSYMLSIGLYLGARSPWLERLARWQPAFAVLPLASALAYLLGFEPFFLGYHERPPTSLVLQIVGESVPRNARHPAETMALLTMLVADLVVLVRVCSRAPRRDAWVFAGVLVTCAAVAFEVVAMRVGFRYAVPVLFAANLIEVLRITYVSTLRAGREIALLERALEEQRGMLESQMLLLQERAPLSALGEQTVGIGHEMRNPLGSATLFVEAARRRAQEGSEQSELLGHASRALEQLAALVTGIGHHARSRERGPTGPVALASVVEDSVALCAARIRSAGARVSVDVDPEIVVLGRRTELAQVFVNLVANGCDAVEPAPEKEIGIEARREACGIVVRVSDTGTPPPVGAAHDIFAPFFTTKAARGGTGLGLSISRRILEDLGCALTLDPQAARTTFVVRLVPCAERLGSPASAPARFGAPAAPR